MGFAIGVAIGIATGNIPVSVGGGLALGLTIAAKRRHADYSATS